MIGGINMSKKASGSKPSNNNLTSEKREQGSYRPNRPSPDTKKPK